MEVLDAENAWLTALEVLRIQSARRPLETTGDARELELLGAGGAVAAFRRSVARSLRAHCCESAGESGIVEFCGRIGELGLDLEPQVIRNIIALRPANDLQLAALFPTPEKWGQVADLAEEIVQIVSGCFPNPSDTS